MKRLCSVSTAMRAGLTTLAAVLLAGSVAGSASAADARFRLFPSKSLKACFQESGQVAKAVATVKRGKLNDTLTLELSGFKPRLNFDLFTVQRSNQLADGSPDPNFKNFGLAWYQSDVHVGADGTGTVEIKTILLDQIFGFDPDVTLAPTNTFHVGFWFNNPKDAAPCGFTGTTPFNGEHNAGPLAFITRPDATTGLGPLCTDPTGGPPFSCNP